MHPWRRGPQKEHNVASKTDIMIELIVSGYQTGNTVAVFVALVATRGTAAKPPFGPKGIFLIRPQHKN